MEVAPESTLESLLSSSELQPSNIILKVYTCGLRIRVTTCDWLRIVWSKESMPTTPTDLDSRFAALQNKYQEVFSETLGTITPISS